jgi:hypothetical protein
MTAAPSLSVIVRFVSMRFRGAPSCLTKAMLLPCMTVSGSSRAEPQPQSQLFPKNGKCHLSEPTGRCQLARQDFPVKCDDLAFPECSPFPPKKVTAIMSDRSRIPFQQGAASAASHQFLELSRSRGCGLECADKSSADPRQSPLAGFPARLIVTSFLNHE